MGLSVMLIVNMVQRLVGLLRNLSFCRNLSDAELGHWALANSFFIIAAPLVVIGLPGAFGKFVEVYRLRGQLNIYLRYTTALCIAAVIVSLAILLSFSQHFSWLIFNDTLNWNTFAWLAVTLVAVTIFNSVNELISSLREVRLVSVMQFVNSVSFAVIGGAALAIQPSWSVLLPAYSLSCLIGTLPGAWLLIRNRSWTEHGRDAFVASDMWLRVLPFAFVVWCNNLLTNLFELGDRYMLLHLSPGGSEVGQALAGQYHCGRIIPNLLTSLAMLLCGVLLPYLSADWERGDTKRVESRLNHCLQFVAVSFTLVSIAAMAISPFLFDYYLDGRYSAAESILPQVMLQCIWLSLFLVAQAYLFCIERGRQIIGIQLFGLALNLVLNYFLIQHWALAGAVTSTTIAYGVIMALMSWRLSSEGTTLGWNTMAICFAPATLLLGPIAATGMILAIVVLATRTNWLITDADRKLVDEAVLPKLAKLGIHLRSLWLS